MDQCKPPEYIIEVFADPSSVKDVVRGILHTIFFHRFFPSLRPKTRDILDLPLPFVDDVEHETLIDQRTATLVRQLDTSSDIANRNGGVRGTMLVQFFEKKRRKAWFTKGEEEVCWEQWTLDVALATPRTELERGKVRKAMEQMLLKAAMKIVTTVNREKDHLPPITSGESNPFPYQIIVNPKESGWGSRMGIF
ncbi:Meiotically up-regulated gene 66 protein [Golovinomyces cichoracearum]|uniref:Autophagy-related protein 101 n=1 Tax=Golovinomyces cichoracearum TaxID=62708 RepID=A0A420HHX0_9PEZI|nr:Meiotically up-regulated gene 66 protein [Golovinomyces cichoracearum]